mmetsp:Transcript_3711/g.3494  ORF Transcript_3711/g.3494 Transcript_3711/m.3494 type:complete len:92 (-) Transcript_3711:147-422(-)
MYELLCKQNNNNQNNNSNNNNNINNNNDNTIMIQPEELAQMLHNIGNEIIIIIVMPLTITPPMDIRGKATISDWYQERRGALLTLGAIALE